MPSPNLLVTLRSPPIIRNLSSMLTNPSPLLIAVAHACSTVSAPAVSVAIYFNVCIRRSARTGLVASCVMSVPSTFVASKLPAIFLIFFRRKNDVYQVNGRTEANWLPLCPAHILAHVCAFCDFCISLYFSADALHLSVAAC